MNIAFVRKIAFFGLLGASYAQTAAPAANVTPPQPSKPACTSLGPKDDWGDASQFVAGLSDRAYAKDVTPEQNVAWRAFSKSVEADWKRLRRGYLDPLGTWRNRTLGQKTAGSVAFYPFSGPDAANITALFPDAREYLLIGLEPVGCIPATAEGYTPEYLADLRGSLQSAVALGFFKTIEMRDNFKASEVSGVLPLLLVELARSGYSIVDVTAIALTPDGAVTALTNAPKREARGVAIQFKDDRHGARTLRYFSLNLDNASLARKPGTVKYMDGLAVTGSLVKSASYLMHKRSFSTIRGMILAKSGLVLEDDSGVPLQWFDGAAWDVKLYGTYTKPIGLFRNSMQQDLADAYSSRTDIEPLEFGFGYKFRGNESNLLVATKKR